MSTPGVFQGSRRRPRVSVKPSPPAASTELGDERVHQGDRHDAR